MATNYVGKVEELRDAAWRELKASPSFLAFKALDDAVAAMGGQRLVSDAERPRPSVGTFARVKQGRAAKRPSQSDAAEAALREKGEPLPTGRLMEAAQERGATVGGKDPLANIRSTLSKDDRFYSLMRNNMYFWWLSGVPLPSGWQEAPDLLDQNRSDASPVGTNQKGGEADATAT